MPAFPGFNLSILECKLQRCIPAHGASQVLIYPYWNVNESTQFKLRRKYHVLIYPYWNVNKFTISADTPRTRFNLSILECKYGNHTRIY